eukprot:365296-Chlamydomonas_euryale.AAC.4
MMLLAAWAQVDWEAILAEHPDNFTTSVATWLYPSAARGSMGVEEQEASKLFPNVEMLPNVEATLDTLRKRIEILNGVVAGPIPQDVPGALLP